MINSYILKVSLILTLASNVCSCSFSEQKKVRQGEKNTFNPDINYPDLPIESSDYENEGLDNKKENNYKDTPLHELSASEQIPLKALECLLDYAKKDELNIQNQNFFQTPLDLVYLNKNLENKETVIDTLRKEGAVTSLEKAIEQSNIHKFYAEINILDQLAESKKLKLHSKILKKNDQVIINKLYDTINKPLNIDEKNDEKQEININNMEKIAAVSDFFNPKIREMSGQLHIKNQNEEKLKSTLQKTKDTFNDFQTNSGKIGEIRVPEKEIDFFDINNDGTKIVLKNGDTRAVYKINFDIGNGNNNSVCNLDFNFNDKMQFWNNIKFREDENYISISDHIKGSNIIYDLKNKREIARKYTSNQPFCPIFSPNGMYLAYMSNNTNSKINFYNISSQYNSNDVNEISLGTDYIRAHSFSPCSEYIAAILNTSLKIWKISDRSVYKELALPETKGYRVLKYRPDGKVIALILQHDKLNIYNIETGQNRIYDLKLNQGWCTSISFNPENDNMIAVGCNNGNTLLINLQSGKKVTYKGHSSSIDRIIFKKNNNNKYDRFMTFSQKDKLFILYKIFS